MPWTSIVCAFSFASRRLTAAMLVSVRMARWTLSLERPGFRRRSALARRPGTTTSIIDSRSAISFSGWT
jgi:hypothetical protein